MIPKMFSPYLSDLSKLKLYTYENVCPSLHDPKKLGDIMQHSVNPKAPSRDIDARIDLM